VEINHKDTYSYYIKHCPRLNNYRFGYLKNFDDKSEKSTADKIALSKNEYKRNAAADYNNDNNNNILKIQAIKILSFYR
jgi:hypothetical protein